MKGVRSKSNLYELQVRCGNLGHKSENDVVFGSKRLTFKDDKNTGLEGDIVKISANIHMNDVNFEHLIEHVLSYTLKRVDKDVSYVNGLMFGTIDKDCLIEATSGE